MTISERETKLENEQQELLNLLSRLPEVNAADQAIRQAKGTQKKDKKIEFKKKFGLNYAADIVEQLIAFKKSEAEVVNEAAVAQFAGEKATEIKEISETQKATEQKAIQTLTNPDYIQGAELIDEKRTEEVKKGIVAITEALLVAKAAEEKDAAVAALRESRKIERVKTRKPLEGQKRQSVFKGQFEAAKAVFSKKSEEELEGATIKETNENFTRAARKLWKDFAVHGVLRKNQETGEIELQKFTDLDGKAATGLLKAAGLDIRKLQYVYPGESLPGYTNIDTGGKSGVEFQETDKSVFIDHHGAEENNSSSTDLTYQTLVKLGLLKKEKHLDKLVEFVNYEDSKTFPNEEFYFKDSDKNLLGLSHFMKFEKLEEFFKDGHTPTESLKKEDLMKYGLIYKDNHGQIIDRPAEQKKIIDDSLAKLKEIEEQGMIFESPEYGRIVVDKNGQVKGGGTAARAYDCPVYINWNKTGFFISSKKPLAADFILSEGIKVRNRMYLKSADQEPLKITLEEVLEKFGVNLEKRELTGAKKSPDQEGINATERLIKVIDDFENRVVAEKEKLSKASEQTNQAKREKDIDKLLTLTDLLFLAGQLRSEIEQAQEVGRPEMEKLIELEHKLEEFKTAVEPTVESKVAPTPEVPVAPTLEPTVEPTPESAPTPVGETPNAPVEEPQKSPIAENELEELIKTKLSQFGISKDDIGQIKNFNNLNTAQQLLVIEGLKQMSLTNVKDSAKQEFAADVQKRNFFGKVWKNITKNYEIAKNEKAAAQQKRWGGLKEHQENLERLTEMISTMDSWAEVREGKVFVNYLGPDDLTISKELAPEQKELLTDFNLAAQNLASLPQDWSFETAKAEERDQYQKALEEYNLLKNKVLEIYNQEWGEKSALLTMNKVDYQIKMQQFLNAHPQAEKELDKIADQKAWKKMLAGVAVERGSYMAAGFALRTSLIGMIGVAGLPLAVAGIAAYRAEKRAAKNLQEKDISGRRQETNQLGWEADRKYSLQALQKFVRDTIPTEHFSKEKQFSKTTPEETTEMMKDIPEEAVNYYLVRGNLKELRKLCKNYDKNKKSSFSEKDRAEICQVIESVPQAIKTWLKTASPEEKEEYWHRKLQYEEVNAYSDQEKMKKNDKTAKHFWGAESLTQKLNLLINKLHSESDQAKRTELFDSLRVRVDFTEEKLEAGLVNFGLNAQGRSLGNNLALTQALSEARLALIWNKEQLQMETKLENRLEQFIDHFDFEHKLDRARKIYIVKETAKGAVIGAAFTMAGSALRGLLSSGAEVLEQSNTGITKNTETLIRETLRATEQNKSGGASPWAHFNKSGANPNFNKEMAEAVAVGHGYGGSQADIISKSGAINELEVSNNQEALDVAKYSFENEISNADLESGQTDSVWRSTEQIFNDHAKELGYQGDLDNPEELHQWAEAQTAKAINNTDDLTDKVFEGNKVILEQDANGDYTVRVEEGNGLTPGHLETAAETEQEIIKPEDKPGAETGAEQMSESEANQVKTETSAAEDYQPAAKGGAQQELGQLNQGLTAEEFLGNTNKGLTAEEFMASTKGGTAAHNLAEKDLQGIPDNHFDNDSSEEELIGKKGKQEVDTKVEEITNKPRLVATEIKLSPDKWDKINDLTERLHSNKRVGENRLISELEKIKGSKLSKGELIETELILKNRHENNFEELKGKIKFLFYQFEIDKK
ncbi:MAG: hypothetical protein WC523_01585 [Patescibacteria group bacterium]